MQDLNLNFRAIEIFDDCPKDMRSERVVIFGKKGCRYRLSDYLWTRFYWNLGYTKYVISFRDQGLKATFPLLDFPSMIAG